MAVNSRPISLTISPRAGIGTFRHCLNASLAADTALSYCDFDAKRNEAIGSPSNGEIGVYSEIGVFNFLFCFNF